jgi:hypothetical protein
MVSSLTLGVGSQSFLYYFMSDCVLFNVNILTFSYAYLIHNNKDLD